MENKARYIWVDNVKVLAFILVALGHMLMGLYDAGIFSEKTYPSGFVNIIYLFHVQLFFICSGFLYQQLTKMNGFKDYGKNILKKLLALGIPYFVFATAAYVIKRVFSSSVIHGNNGGFINQLLVEPAAPYWFLYALFLLFLISPVMKNKADAVIRLVASVALYIVFNTVNLSFLPAALFTVVKYICNFAFYFNMGMAISVFDLPRFFRKSGGILFLVFLAVAIPKELYGFGFTGLELILGTLACAGIISFFGKCFESGAQPKALAFLYRFSLPVFLMHSLFAAAVRTVLIKVGITNLPLHLAAGLVACFILPVAAGFIMEKTKLDFLYQPTKYIKIK